MKIKILSNTTINRIAAGEVVERPASVVKELVENSIDAKATKIDIIIENAGRNLITIIDDGFGMEKEDIALAIERHATSKLSDEDIHDIKFLGFRGEALPSIASVSRMNITSRFKESLDDFAWCLQVEGGIKQDLMPSSLSGGTKIEVRDLFFATPARLKFLKAEKTETNNIYETVIKIAMANPEIAFSLNSDGKELLNLKAYQGEEALFNRLKDIVGKNFEENFTKIDYQDEEASIYGYISAPTHNIGTTNEQYIFINKRPIRDKLISMAIKIAYQDFIPSGRHPLVFIFLELDPTNVDVNVHPTKAEVRFKDPNSIRSIIVSAIKHGIKNIGKNSSAHITEAAISSFTAHNSNINISNNEIKAKETTLSFMEQSAPTVIRPLSSFSSKSNNYATSKPTAFTQNLSQRIFAPLEPVAPTIKSEVEEFSSNQIDFPLGSACAQIHDTYILSQTTDGFILVDQHAAHERIFYENLKKQILSGNITTQRLFIPEIIELKEHVIEELMALREEFAKFGLYYNKFGSNEISVTELPAILKCVDIKKLILEIVDDIAEYGQGMALENKINHYLATFACHHSIRSGRALSIKEMNSLLREMENSDHSGQCNHGRPTYIKLSLKDIEKLFERC